MFDLSISVSWAIPFVASAIFYINRRIKTRRRIAESLISEINENENNFSGLRPHLIQSHIVPGPPQNGRERLADQESPRIQEGIVPPPSRFSKAAYRGAAPEVGRFNEGTAEDVIDYYRNLDYVSGLIDSLHRGTDLPPAAFTLLESKFHELGSGNDALVEDLRVEKRRFPTLYRKYTYLKRNSRFNFGQYLQKLQGWRP